VLLWQKKYEPRKHKGASATLKLVNFWKLLSVCQWDTAKNCFFVDFSALSVLVAKKELATKTQRRKRYTKLVFFVSSGRYVGKLLQKIAFSWILVSLEL
jgi:hypothetical protein